LSRSAIGGTELPRQEKAKGAARLSQGTISVGAAPYPRNGQARAGSRIGRWKRTLDSPVEVNWSLSAVGSRRRQCRRSRGVNRPSGFSPGTPNGERWGGESPMDPTGSKRCSAGWGG